MGYYIDLEKISIDQYKKILKEGDLIPSRIILKENIDTYFAFIIKQNIQNVNDLLNISKTKTKLQEFSIKSTVPLDYLTILVREIKGYRQSPSKIKDFPNIPDQTIARLEKEGIKNTLHLFDKVLTSKDRLALSQQTGIDKKDILKLTKLTDLVRIKWVNHTFANVLFECAYDTAEKVAKADYTELYEAVKKLNAERKLYNAHIGLHDMKLCVEAAKVVPLNIKY